MTPLATVKGPTEKPFCPVAIVRLVVTLSALISTPFAATTDVVPVTTVPVTVVPVIAAAVLAPMVVPLIVPPVMATLLAFWVAIVPKPDTSDEETVPHAGASESEPVPV